MNTKYLVNKVVINDDSSVLFKEARDVLFSDNISNYLYKIGDVNYLMSPAYENDGKRNINDIILATGTDTNKTYYIVEVKVVDNTSSFEDKTLIAELLLQIKNTTSDGSESYMINDNEVLKHYFEESELEIYDQKIKEYFISKGILK